ncbi:nitroreductase family protein [Candidatus Woesearchaeota archaeon]|nr:nitroreductase family protein [Candidatus Woesearchaeota archaeon]
MDVYDCMKKVCSTRSYLSKDVTNRNVAKILNAAHFAPSSGNIQNWRFIVVRDKDKKKEIARVCMDQLWIQEAPVVIIVCSDNSNIKLHYEKNWKKYSRENCAAAIQNLIVEAENIGLSSCWVRNFNELRIANTLKIPDSVSVEAVITIGYSKHRPIEKKHKIEELVFFENYGNRTRGISLFPLQKHLKKLIK